MRKFKDTLRLRLSISVIVVNILFQTCMENKRTHANAHDSINEGSIEIIQDKLYWISSDTPPVSEVDAFYFNTDTISFLVFISWNKNIV